MNTMVTETQRRAFADRGLLRLDGAFARAEARAMEDRLWAELERRYGARRGAPHAWRLGWATGLQDLKADSAFDPIVITHPWLLHSPAPNRGTAPRFMRVQRIHADASCSGADPASSSPAPGAHP